MPTAMVLPTSLLKAAVNEVFNLGYTNENTAIHAAKKSTPKTAIAFGLVVTSYRIASLEPVRNLANTNSSRHNSL
jgi:hypothetical protein